MAILTVGPTSTFPTIAAAMAAAGTGDIISLESGYGNENATVTVDGLSFDGGPSSTGINLQLVTGISAITLLGAAPINVTDGSDANAVVGNDGDNIISVSSGVDVVTAGNGTDRLIIDYSAATASITGTPVNVTDGGTHAVTFTGVENFTISTGSGNDTLTVTDGSNVLNTDGGNDTITAGNGPNIIDGGADNDTITAGSGVNTIDGGLGNDTIVAGDGGNTVNGGDGDDGITTGIGNDVVVAGLGNDTVITGGGADVTTVNGGIDTVDSGSESDRLIVNFSSSTTAVNGGVTGGTLGGGYDGAFADVAGTSSVVFQVTENFTVTTGSGNDAVTTGDGVDFLEGGTGGDVLDSGGGNDVLNGGVGIDTMIGRGGDDTFYLDDAGDQVIEAVGGGTDRVLSYVDYRLAAGEEIEFLDVASASAGTDMINLRGNEFAQTVIGNAGQNTLNGGGGADTLIGRGGDDTFYVDDAGDQVIEAVGGGTDRVLTYVDYTLAAGQEVEFLDVAAASSGTDMINLTGNEFAQTVIGNAGQNTLNGAGGADTLIGRGGDDTFVFRRGQADGDTVVDFDGNGAASGDQLTFEGYGPGATFAQIDALHWQISYDSGASHEVITFSNAASIQQSDYFFV